MQLTNTNVIHDGSALQVDFVGEGGELVSVRMGDAQHLDDLTAIQHAKVMMAQLTALGTGDRDMNFDPRDWNPRRSDGQGVIPTPTPQDVKEKGSAHGVRKS